MAKDQNSYLEYLDKEMAIMGVLSAFCVAVVGFFFQALGSATFVDQTPPPPPDKVTMFSTLWSRSPWCLMAGSACILVAARLFYEQRSTLAFYYGQISLAIEAPKQINSTDSIQWMKEADSWATWLYYRLAFRCLWLGLIIYGFAFLQLQLKVPQFSQLMWFSIAVCVAWVLAAVFSEAVVYRKYKDKHDPWGAFWRSLSGQKPCSADEQVSKTPEA
jgi:hypothetical protein